jgi:predicted Kef-type K+ transport protein
VKSTALVICIGITVLSAISFAVSMKNGEFKTLKSIITPNQVYFFLTIGMPVIGLPVFLIARKYSMAVEFFIPLYAIYLTFFLLPTWTKHPKLPHMIMKASLLQANNFTYILNLCLICFFSSNYIIALAWRSVLTMNNLNMSFRRWLAGDSTLLPVLFNFFTTMILLEGHAYNLNKQKVELFLEKEKIKMQEEQT